MFEIKDHENLKKVVILEHTPRFDKGYRDPMSLKPRLAEVANRTFGDLWLKSEFRERIVIGHHKFDCSTSDAHYSRYRSQFNGRYDGVHFYGPNARRDFTNSVKNILKFALPNQFYSKKTSTSVEGRLGSGYNPIPTKNRFESLNSDLGNY